MIKITFEAHATSLDNEQHLASGFNDVALSSLGEEQASQMGEHYAGKHFDAIFCSNLQRSYKTAELAFGSTFPIVTDQRLRECNYGHLTQHDKAEIDAMKKDKIDSPFPGGESYRETAERMRAFLADLLRNYDGKIVMLVGHRATQYGLEYWINDRKLRDIVTEKWAWQPGWHYTLKTIPATGEPPKDWK